MAESVASGRHVVLEMPTGSGKTVVLLAGALDAALRAGKRILYVSRTHAQQEQTIREFNAIRERAGLSVRAFALQGRARLCLKLEEGRDPEWAEASPEELSHFCSAAKAATDRDPGSPRACRFWERLRGSPDEELHAWLGAGAHTAEWVREAAADRGLCPYELVKRLLPTATLVVAPYVFAFDTGLRRRLLEWWGCQEKDVVLIVDEAHNVPAYLRETHSPRLTRERLRRALVEADDLGNPEVARGVPCKAFLEGLALELDALVNEYCKDEDGFIPPFALETALMERFGVTSLAFHEAATTLHGLGEAIRDRRKLLGRIPRSHLSHLSAFLAGWLESDEEGYVKLAGRAPQRYLEAFLVDTARLADRVTDFFASIHASGTLDPLEEYRDSLGLGPETQLARFPTAFPPEALRIECVQGVSTRYETLRQDPEAADRLQEATRRVLAALRVKAACFLPSHRLLSEFAEVGVFDGLAAAAQVESTELGSAQLATLLQRHRTAPSSLLVGVVGGRLSEGLDFPGPDLEAMVIVGMPFPKPSAHQRALLHYHEVRHGRGWDYAVRAPTLRRLRQTMGRLIRAPTDRGFVVVLDERAAPFLRSAGIDAHAATLESAVEALGSWQTEVKAAAAQPSARHA